jgi:hypothetical protein
LTETLTGTMGGQWTWNESAVFSVDSIFRIHEEHVQSLEEIFPQPPGVIKNVLGLHEAEEKGAVVVVHVLRVGHQVVTGKEIIVRYFVKDLSSVGKIVVRNMGRTPVVHVEKKKPDFTGELSQIAVGHCIEFGRHFIIFSGMVIQFSDVFHPVFRGLGPQGTGAGE